ncbi:hypothetical protein GPY51_03675 [Photorhabdus laumondii subsp. laumondii]|uniref:Photorhabdus luminescens subsp. laumondii TTO1 complete genome segment 9/17 n=4 Tax=Photorhabdus TaxID=29487 RepID=Q7N4D1_PHOLL|nr:MULTISPECIES: hypothetical protein [Photorhabdus]AWK42168.1 hypothetical protein A4R40_12020 [Photorhabdus laumondii subsp. laumondii]AXG43029.1 hypothetical protein PluDJC_12735 [Photorhabdus laumondii subsp. laumondii]AXG47488.1 hypothetical protein PluTT01m_12395 [Photorhabdus laumondii subsp. laumondii]MCC8386137.1 hypothetical protein [Photorhabdus laumondii]MCC8390774.1 hypothetical protein [Photorhabdus laumondii]
MDYYLNRLSNRVTFIDRRNSEFYKWLSTTPEFHIYGDDAKEKLNSNLFRLSKICPELFIHYTITTDLRVKPVGEVKIKIMAYEDYEHEILSDYNLIKPLTLFLKETTNGLSFFFVVNHFLSDALSNGMISNLLSGEDTNWDLYEKNHIKNFVSSKLGKKSRNNKYNLDFIKEYCELKINNSEKSRFPIRDMKLESSTSVLRHKVLRSTSDNMITAHLIKAIASSFDEYFGGEHLYIGLNQHGREPTYSIDPRYTLGWLNEIRPLIIKKSENGYCVNDIKSRVLMSTLYGGDTNTLLASNTEYGEVGIQFPSICLNVINKKWFTGKINTQYKHKILVNDRGACRIMHIGIGLIIDSECCDLTLDFSSLDYEEHYIRGLFYLLIENFNNSHNINFK